MSVNDVHHLIMTSSSASCKLDPIPTWLLKRCSSEISPVIIKMINLSFQDCHFPGSWKIAHVNPLLKRSGLDAEFANFRPVSNLSFVSKGAFHFDRIDRPDRAFGRTNSTTPST